MPLNKRLPLLLAFAVTSGRSDDNTDMPMPWYRTLSYDAASPLQSGKDVTIAQTLLNRNPEIALPVDGVYGASTAAAVEAFQGASGIVPADGIFMSATAGALLACCLQDGYRDSGAPASDYGKLYKIVVPLPSANRSVETNATLLDKDNNAIRSFRVRCHGVRDDGTSAAWPDFGDGDYGLNMLSSNGNTPTGLASIDLNSPEPASSEQFYGPYPVNRVVAGLEGNMGLLLSTDADAAIRSGILLHTGEWANATDGAWDPSQPMPNSDGCLHAHPEDIEAVWQDLMAMGVDVHDNPFSTADYPYDPQGIISVYLDDGGGVRRR